MPSFAAVEPRRGGLSCRAIGKVQGPAPDPWLVAGPQPDPWRLGTIEVGLYGAIALYQMGRLVSGPSAEGYSAAAVILFDDTCGSVPLSVLIWILLHRPPPPPPQ